MKMQRSEQFGKNLVVRVQNDVQRQKLDRKLFVKRKNPWHINKVVTRGLNVDEEEMLDIYTQEF